MKTQKNKIRLVLIFLVLLVIGQGCLGQQQTVELIETPVEPITCSKVRVDGLDSVSNNQLVQTLDRALYENDFTCWKSIIKTALIEGRDLPLNHLAKAVHAFNTNQTKDIFSIATHQYFLQIVKGNAQYQNKDRNLLKAWISFEIRQAKTQNDANLKKAKRVCQRLDRPLYNKFFL